MAEDSKEIRRKEIKGFLGYEIDSEGTIWSCWKSLGCGRGHELSKEWKVKKPALSKSGYVRATLRRSGRLINLQQHRIVLEAFVGVCPVGQEACHNNGIKTDNRLLNLRWDTHKNNLLDKKAHGSWQEGENHPRAKLTEAQAVFIKNKAGNGDNLDYLACMFQVSRSAVEKIKYGNTWKHITPIYAA